MAHTFSKTDLNLWMAFLGEAKANRLYTAYALKALEEGKPEVAQVFLEAAGAETAHAISHLRTLKAIGTTEENLRRVLKEEAREIASMYPRMIREAQEEGRQDAVATFTLAWEREQHHLRIFQEAAQRLGLKDLEPEGPPPSLMEVRPWRLSLPARLMERARQELRGEKERIAALTRIREVVFGVQDGLISTVALLAGVFGALTERYPVIVAGMASALAGTFSMAMGSYLGSKAEKEVLEAEIAKEREELERSPAEEMAELVEMYRAEGFTFEQAVERAQRLAQDKPAMLRTMLEKELGISPELTQEASPFKDALAMGFSYILAAVIPLTPYFILTGLPALAMSLGVTGLALFAIGAGKTRWTRRNPFWSGLEVFLLGTLSGLLGYGLGTLLPRFLGAPPALG
ncbi:MAG: VIT1/CCC1 transporter family protein [Dehalococcoidia bacterium]|nr:VIT1/CCC1 transporter family protein [Dehalococcoidia bacterium]MDW8120603.1 VIT1/CCC1 transporter family protein [Chloroflexota bacterium]